MDGIEKLAETNQLIVEQLEYVKGGGDLQRVAGIIDRGEEIIQTIAKLVPSIATLIRWYQTEKIRIGPGNQEQVLEKTIHIHSLLKQVLEIYGASELSTVEAV